MDLLNLAKQLNVTVKHSNLDYAYGPYYNKKDASGQIVETSIQNAENSLQYIKSVGLTVLCENADGTFDEYWYKDNTNNLTKKINIEPASSAALGVIMTGYLESSASIPLKLDKNNKAYVELTSSSIGAAGGAVGSVIHTINSADGIQLYAQWSPTNLSGIIGVESLYGGSGWIGLKKATDGALGGIKTGYKTDSENRQYGVKVDDTGNAYVNVPWESSSGSTGGSETTIEYASGSIDMKGGQIKQNGTIILDTNSNLSSATAQRVGGIKVSSVNASAVTVNSESTTAGRYYPIELNSDGKAIVNVPWTNTNDKTTQTAIQSGYTNWRCLLVGSSNGSASNFTPANVTDQTYAASAIKIQPSSGDIITSGEISATNGFYESSDERLKDFGEKVSVDLDKLSELKKNYFTWKDSENKEQQIGVSAQEIRELYPEIVSEQDNGTLTVAYDKLSVIALAAIDELHKKNKELEERLTALENKLK